VTSVWSRCLRCGSVAACLLGLEVWILLGAWVSVSCECCQVGVSAMGWSLVQSSYTEYCISRPIRRTFFPKNVTSIRPASYAPRVSIIFKLINTHTCIIHHLYCEIVKTTVKMILVAVTTIFWVSLMNKWYYGC